MSAIFPEHKGLDLPKIAEDLLDYWKEHQVFEQSISSREGQNLTFFEGPPSANGFGVQRFGSCHKDIFLDTKP